MGKYIAVQAVVLAVVVVSLGGGCVVGAVGDGVMVLPVGSLVPSLVARIIVASAGIQVYCQFLVGPGIRHPRRYRRLRCPVHTEADEMVALDVSRSDDVNHGVGTCGVFC